jgi:hypothetical protein
MSVRRRTKKRSAAPRDVDAIEIPRTNPALVLHPHERMLSFMASFSLVTGQTSLAQGYLGELVAHIADGHA